MKVCKYKHILASAAACSLFGFVSQPAFSQVTTVDVSGAEGSPANIEELTVTGTSIRGIAPVGAAPISYGREDIEADSPVDIRDALSNVPQISNFGTDADQSTSNRFRTSGYQPIIHNLGIYSTLTLFNGHRMADVGGEAVFPDPAILPTIGIERVEVIADGASAIYGSDAVAGVVNFLYRRGVDGFELSSTLTHDPDTSWENTNFGALWGNTFDRGEVMVAYEYSEHLRPLIGEYALGANANHEEVLGVGNGLNNSSTSCEYARIGFGGTNYSGPNATPGSTYRCSPDAGESIASNGERHAVLATARYSLTDTVEVWGEFNFSDYNAFRLDGWGGSGRVLATIPSTNDNFFVPVGADPTGVTSESYRIEGIGLFGYRTREGSSKVQGLTLGADIDIGGGWQTSIMMHKSRTNDYNYDPGVDLGRTIYLIENDLWDPWNEPVPASLNNGYVQLNDTSQSLEELSVKADGPAFSLPAGEVMVAIGSSFRAQRARQIQSAGCAPERSPASDVGCSFYRLLRDDDINRGVSAVFAEAAVPVTSNFMLSLAGRYDNYEGLPGDFNPKVGFTWEPLQDLSVHGSWGTSFVAPNMGLITAIFGVPQLGTTGNEVTNGGVPSNNPDGYDFDIYNLGGGNPDLESEEAESYSMGFNWEPASVDGLSVGVTYYNVEYSNLIYKPTRNDVLRNDSFIGSRELGDYDAGCDCFLPFSPAQVDALIEAAPPQSPILDGQTFNMAFNSFAINIGTRIHAGYDFNIRYDMDTSFGIWGLGVVANKQTKFDEEVTPGSGFFTRLGTGDAPGWQTRYEVKWASNELPLRANWIANYKSGYDDGGAFEQIDSTLMHNLSVAYDFNDLLDGVTLQGRIRNVLDEDPPYYGGSSAGYDNDNATPYGRQFEMSVRAKF